MCKAFPKVEIGATLCPGAPAHPHHRGDSREAPKPDDLPVAESGESVHGRLRHGLRGTLHGLLAVRVGEAHQPFGGTLRERVLSVL